MAGEEISIGYLLTLDPTIKVISVLTLIIISIGLLLRRYGQPYIIGYILAGVLMGEFGLGLIKNAKMIYHLGEIGIILLMFFIGMEISLPDLVKQWRIAAIGTIIQVGLSVAALLAIGHYFSWDTSRSVALGFVIALSSSAVIIKLIQDRNLIDTKMGRNVLSILLTQDMILIPLLIIISFLGGGTTSTISIILMITGGLVIMLALAYIYSGHQVDLPFGVKIFRDHELQVFIAILFCFGGALITSLFGLSPALGAFVGGMAIHASRSTRWIHDTLHSFRVLFVACFFVSIGLQLDLHFILENASVIILMLVVVYITNHLINSLILRAFSCTWREALLGGALLAQIGELSFLLSSSAFEVKLLGEFEYKFTISLISLTLFMSPFWISLSERVVGSRRSENHSGVILSK